MREIFDRHAERLTLDERQAIWEAISNPGRREARALEQWTRAAAVAMAAAVVVAVIQQAPESLHPMAPSKLGRSIPMAEPPAPAVDRAERHTPRTDVESRVERERARLADIASRVDLSTPSTQPIAPRVAVPGSAAIETTPAPPGTPAGTGVLTGRITDPQNRPVPYANVIVPETRMGTMTDADGSYRITGLPPAKYTLQIQALGHPKEVRTGIQVVGDQMARTDVQVKDEVVKTMEGVEVRGEKRIDTKSSSTKQNITSEKLKELPVDNLHLRSGRSGEVKFLVGGAPVGGLYGRPAPVPRSNSPAPQAVSAPAQPPVVPTTGGTALPNDEAFDSMFFKNHGVNPFIPADEDPLSTFAVDVDAASYTLARRYLELGQLPPADAVRVEEFVNFFRQGYPQFESEDFRVVIDGAPSPFGSGYHLLRIGIKGREVVARNRKPAQLTFIIDVSGSMGREDRLELVKRALRLLVDELRAEDRVGIVVYGNDGRVLLEPIALGGAGRRRILEAIDQLHPEGSTNAEDGLRLGYVMARLHYRPEAINRIVLCSDGVANVGLTGPQSILAQVRTDADRGIHLTTIGFGMGNYNDVLMEQLADRGDGNHYYVDDIDEARRVFVENLTGTLQTIAKDAKVQVEFDSTRVLRYRLLGFENRDVADRDFRNDKVDAGEIGAGHEVTALYEVKLAPRVTEGTLATVRLRYARPEQDGAGAPRAREIEQRFDVASLVPRFEDASPRFRLDAAVAEFAEILRKSYWAKEGRLSDVLSVARSAARGLHDATTAEFISLVEKAAALSARAKPGQER